MRRALQFVLFVLPSLSLFDAGCSAVQLADSRLQRAETGQSETEKRLEKLGAKPCVVDSDDPTGFLCVQTKHRLEHQNRNSKEITVTFAVHPAPEATRKGIFFNSTGGPGYSGLQNMRDYGKIDPRIVETFDVVFFDLRGVGESGHLECKKAATEFYLGGLRSGSEAEDDALVAKSRTFVDACVKEMGIPREDVPFYNTEEAAADLEEFRQLLQVDRDTPEDKITIYGLSYGTQLMQTYARNYPEHTRKVVIDGVVDLTLGHLEYMKNLNDGIDLLLEETFEDCAKKPRCAAPFAKAPGADALARIHAAYDVIATHLDKAQETVKFPKMKGGVDTRYFSRHDLDTTSFNAAGTPESRRDLMAALGAAYSKGDYVPFLTTSYSAAGIDDVDGQGAIGTANADPDISDAIYYAVTCSDYGHESPDEATRLENYLAAGRELRAQNPRITSPFFGDLPCVFWPTNHVSAREKTLRNDGIPTMVIDASGDGATPYDMGKTVFQGLADGYFVDVAGGHHVMYAQGNHCVDTAASDFILDVEHAHGPARTKACKDVFVAR
jgi:pimeloyl-ACP methyl ester carboxylesterase